MITHHPLHIVKANLFVRLNPQWEWLTFGFHHPREIFVHAVGKLIEISPDSTVATTRGCAVKLAISQ